MGPLSLNVVGCGRLGKALGKLLQQKGHMLVQSVLNRTSQSSEAAAEWIGGGARSTCSLKELPPANVHLIGAQDGYIEEIGLALAQTSVVRPGDIVFHCSGALASSVLAPLQQQGARIASVHPAMSFADPESAVECFQGTYCAVEGEPSAVETLSNAITAIGGIPFPIDSSGKDLYHAGCSLVCNNIVALLEAGVQTFEAAGVSREQALGIMQPLVAGTVRASFSKPLHDALTGPVSRCDVQTIKGHLSALDKMERRRDNLNRAGKPQARGVNSKPVRKNIVTKPPSIRLAYASTALFAAQLTHRRLDEQAAKEVRCGAGDRQRALENGKQCGSNESDRSRQQLVAIERMLASAAEDVNVDATPQQARVGDNSSQSDM